MIVEESLPLRGEIWHKWDLLEEVGSNMWGSVSHRATWLEIAKIFTRNSALYGEWMLKVADSWKFSCEHNLTKPGDKRPWIGHAAVALAIGCPEDVVREAWGYLTIEQQNSANKQAEMAINYWREKNA